MCVRPRSRRLPPAPVRALIEAGSRPEENVSGKLAADDRELGRLIQKVEAGESGGIVVRYVDRFGRDMIENATAHDRIVKAGGRLIATASGYDTAHLTADTRMVFNIQSAIAEAQRERNAEHRQAGRVPAVDRGRACGVLGRHLHPSQAPGTAWDEGRWNDRA